MPSLSIHIQNMKIFDNSGIFSNASTIPTESVSAEIAGICRILVKVPENAEIAGIVEDLPELPGLSKSFIFWLILSLSIPILSIQHLFSMRFVFFSNFFEKFDGIFIGLAMTILRSKLEVQLLEGRQTDIRTLPSIIKHLNDICLTRIFMRLS